MFPAGPQGSGSQPRDVQVPPVSELARALQCHGPVCQQGTNSRMRELREAPEDPWICEVLRDLGKVLL